MKDRGQVTSHAGSDYELTRGRVVAMWNEGLSMAVIRERLGISPFTGWRMLDSAEANGIAVTRRRRNGKHVVITKPR